VAAPEETGPSLAASSTRRSRSNVTVLHEVWSSAAKAGAAADVEHPEAAPEGLEVPGQGLRHDGVPDPRPGSADILLPACWCSSKVEPAEPVQRAAGDPGDGWLAATTHVRCCGEQGRAWASGTIVRLSTVSTQMSPGAETIEDRRTSPAEPGDHERFSHYVEKDKLTEAMVMGTPVVALCGKVWVPSRDPEKYPVCPECKDAWQKLRDDDKE
jgi:hypothetical protein